MISYDDIKSGKAAAPVAVAAVAKEIGTLPAMVKAAAAKLASATTAAEVLDAKDAAALVYDASKRAARMAKAKKAHDDLIAAAHRAQADALDIEAAAKRRLADEYDGGQERGEIVGPKGGGDTTVPARNAATAAEVGITRKEVHEARRVRNAEQAQPGVVRVALDKALDEGKEPSRAVVNEAVAKALGETKPIDTRTDEQRELNDLQKAWDAAGEIARGQFLVDNSLGMASEGMGHSAERVSPIGGSVGANAGERHVDRSALRASSAVKVGATNSPDGQRDEPAATTETVGEYLREQTAVVSVQIIREGDAPRETDCQAGEISQGGSDASCPDTEFHSAKTSPKAADQTGATAAPPVAPVAPTQALSKADQMRLLRPHCQHPGTELCAGSGRNHCHACKKLMTTPEAA